MLDAEAFLAGVRRAASYVQLYPTQHPFIEQSYDELMRAAGSVTEEDGRFVISVLDEAFYLDRRLMAKASIEHGPLIRIIEEKGVESFTITHPVSRRDIEDLVHFLATDSQDVPAAGSIRLNDRPFTRAEIVEAAALSTLRRSYASSLDILRGVTSVASQGEAIELAPAVSSVNDLIEEVLERPGASLLLAGLKTHDQYTFFHSVNTCILALALGRSVGLEGEPLKALGVGALLHDVGKVRVSPAIIQYPGRLNDEQWADIKLHPQEGAQAILGASDASQELAARVAFEHHARVDFNGYPGINRRRPLHLFSMIVSICDVYDALTTRRSYKRAQPPNRALQLLMQGAGTQVDADLVRAFIAMLGIYPAGSLLRMANDEIVMVIGQTNEPGAPPWAVTVRDQMSRLVEDYQPFAIDPASVVDQLLPEQVGLDPAALLEESHLSELVG